MDEYIGRPFPGYLIQNMSQEDLLANIDPSDFAEIKRKGGRLEAFCVAHPGESKTHLVGIGNIVLNWGKNLMQNIKDKFKKKMPVFFDHNADNSHDNRDVIGEVVNTFIDAKNRVIALVHRFKEHLNKKADIASFEAPFIPGIELASGHNVQPQEMGRITGLAIADRENGPPAFEGAERLVSMQCLQKRSKTMDLNEIIAYINDATNKVDPLDIFSIDKIMDLQPVQDALSSKKGNEHQQAQILRLRTQMNDMKTENETANGSLSNELKEAKIKIAKHESSKTFDELVGGRKKLTDQQIKFINLKKENFSPDIENGKSIEDQINGHLDKLVEESNQYQAVFGQAGDEEKEETQDINMPKGTPKDPLSAMGIPC